MANQSFIFSGGNSTFTLPSDLAETDIVNVNVNSAANGSFTFSGENDTAPPAAAGALNVIGPLSADAQVAINPGKTVYDSYYISALGNGSYLTVDNDSFTTGTVVLNGISTSNRFTFYDNATAGTGTLQGTNTLFVLNGENGPTTSNIVDAGGNLTFAKGAAGTGTDTATTNYNIIGYNGTSILAAGGARSTFNIKNNDPSTTGVGAGQQVPSTGSNHLDIVLNTYAPTSASDKLNYVVDQEADAATSLFQSTGALAFTGKNTTLALNGQDSNVALGTADTAASLTGNDQVWVGNGDSYINSTSGTNSIFTAGRGNITVNDTGATGNLTIYGFGNQAGKLTYTQGGETVNIGGQNNDITATLGTGAATIDVSAFTLTAAPEFNITLGAGNLVLNNFTNSAGLNPASHNHIYLAANETVQSVSYTNNNTVYSMSNGSTVTFSGVDLTGNNNNPFSAAPATPAPSPATQAAA